MIFRVLPVAAIAGLGVLAGPSSALAASGGGDLAAPSAVDTPTLTAARGPAVSQATRDVLQRFFAAVPGPDGAAAPARAVPASVRSVSSSVPVYELSPAFVRGDTVPVADLAYVATTVTSSEGAAATVWTARVGGSWQTVDIAAGDEEQRVAAAAQGSPAFEEPQLHAWYAVRHGRVVPLNAEARRSVGAHGVTLAAYQRTVHGRYADKLAGSSYDRRGLAGGFGQEVTGHAARTASPALWPEVAAVAGGFVALGGLLLLRRRRAG